jgi:hypothetical protein
MSTSGTFNYNPILGSVVINAFARIGIKRTEILAEHMANAYMELNNLQSRWSGDGITWWTVELIQQPITAGVSTYTVPLNIVTVLDVYINNGSSNRLIFPFSRTDFASLAEPAEQGFPTVFWWDRVIPSTITLWPTPDNNATYTLNYYAYTQMQDAELRQGGQAQIPYWFIDALVADLAYRLSRMHAPALEAIRKQDSIEAYSTANKQTENADIFINPGLSGYYR